MGKDIPRRSAVTRALNTSANNYAKRDQYGFMSAFVDEEDVVLIGTCADEMRVGRTEIESQVKRDWEQTEPSR